MELDKAAALTLGHCLACWVELPHLKHGMPLFWSHEVPRIWWSYHYWDLELLVDILEELSGMHLGTIH